MYARFICIFGLLACTSCNRADPLREVFADFSYVGAFPIAGVRQPPEHPSTRLTLPASFTVGSIYVFHREGEPIDYPELATTVLPDRLRSAGMKIITAPRNWGDMASIDNGGLLWSIEFQDRHRRGNIQTWNDRNFRRDFVLTLIENSN